MRMEARTWGGRDPEFCGSELRQRLGVGEVESFVTASADPNCFTITEEYMGVGATTLKR